MRPLWQIDATLRNLSITLLLFRLEGDEIEVETNRQIRFSLHSQTLETSVYARLQE